MKKILSIAFAFFIASSSVLAQQSSEPVVETPSPSVPDSLEAPGEVGTISTLTTAQLVGIGVAVVGLAAAAGGGGSGGTTGTTGTTQ